MTTNNRITSPNIFYRKSNQFDEDGLFSERIFGPVKSYRCKCGKLNSKLLDSGKRCDKCGVLCESSEIRFETFGVIDLPFLCIKPNKIDKELTNVVKNINSYRKTLLEPIRHDYNITKSRYIGVNKKTKEIRIFEDRNDKANNVFIPLRITGIYSFILCLKYIANYFIGFDNVRELFEKQYIMSELKVLPPGLRPISYIKNNKIQLSEINKYYISILHLKKNNQILDENLQIDEQDWFDRINLHFEGDFENSDEEIVEHTIIEYDMITSRYQFYINRLYEDIQATISGKEGFIRHNTLGKTIEFSARSVVVVDPSLKPYQIGVSKEILYKLWMLHFLYWLLNVKKINADYCFTNIIKRDDYQNNKEIFNEFLEWMKEKNDD